MTEQQPVGVFRLVTNQSHTRFEGLKRKERKTYFGAGHPKASQGGDLIALTEKEFETFKNPRERLRLVSGDWPPAIKKLIALEEDKDSLPTPNAVEVLLSNASEIVVGEIGEFGTLEPDELELILKTETAGAQRKSITEVCKKQLDEWNGPAKKRGKK